MEHSVRMTWMRSMAAIGMATFLFGSCRKETQIPRPPDNVRYSDIAPDSIVRSVRYYIRNMASESCGDYPVPTDSVAYFELDMDGDAVNDFVFSVHHHEVSDEGSVHCEHVQFTIDISGADEGDSISTVDESALGIPVFYDTTGNSLIGGPDGVWEYWGMVSAWSQGYYPPYIIYLPDSFIGVKVNGNYGWIHVYKLHADGLVIMEYALNLTPGNPIRAGQWN